MPEEEEEKEPLEGKVSEAEGMRRSNARIHFLSPHLASLRASALGSTYLPYLSAHVGYPSRNTLLTQCLVDPIGS